jgi:hypothetical protein
VERVAFLVEETGERIPCLLNPETVVVRRSSGVRRATSPGGFLTGVGLGDDPLVVTGGGRTELELDLLFDTSLLPPPPGGSAGRLPGPGDPPPPAVTTDVRELTAPLWRLAENAPGSNGFGAPPLVRFVWGKAWNVLGLIAAIAERVEQFGPDGGPHRSWLRLRLLRVSDPGAQPEPSPPPSPAALAAVSEVPATPGGAPPTSPDIGQYEVVGEERLDQVAARVFGGRPWLWRLLAAANNVMDPPLVPSGTILAIPPVPPLPAGGAGEPPQQ